MSFERTPFVLRADAACPSRGRRLSFARGRRLSFERGRRLSFESGRRLSFERTPPAAQRRKSYGLARTRVRRRQVDAEGPRDITPDAPAREIAPAETTSLGGTAPRVDAFPRFAVKIRSDLAGRARETDPAKRSEALRKVLTSLRQLRYYGMQERGDWLTRRTLVVDDSETTRRLLRRSFENAGFLVDVARDGAEALQHMRRTPYDLVIMDLEMPVMDGLRSTARAARLRPSSKTTPGGSDAAKIGLGLVEVRSRPQVDRGSAGMGTRGAGRAAPAHLRRVVGRGARGRGQGRGRRPLPREARTRGPSGNLARTAPPGIARRPLKATSPALPQDLSKTGFVELRRSLSVGLLISRRTSRGAAPRDRNLARRSPCRRSSKCRKSSRRPRRSSSSRRWRRPGRPTARSTRRPTAGRRCASSRVSRRPTRRRTR